MVLKWSDPKPPAKAVSRYNHVISSTPLGEITLEWKGWKDNDPPCGEMPWNEFIIGFDLNEAKELAQAAWDRMIPTLLPLCSKNSEST